MIHSDTTEHGQRKVSYKGIEIELRLEGQNCTLTSLEPLVVRGYFDEFPCGIFLNSHGGNSEGGYTTFRIRLPDFGMNSEVNLSVGTLLERFYEKWRKRIRRVSVYTVNCGS